MAQKYKGKSGPHAAFKTMSNSEVAELNSDVDVEVVTKIHNKMDVHDNSLAAYAAAYSDFRFYGSIDSDKLDVILELPNQGKQEGAAAVKVLGKLEELIKGKHGDKAGEEKMRTIRGWVDDSIKAHIGRGVND